MHSRTLPSLRTTRTLDDHGELEGSHIPALSFARTSVAIAWRSRGELLKGRALTGGSGTSVRIRIL